MNYGLVESFYKVLKKEYIYNYTDRGSFSRFKFKIFVLMEFSEGYEWSWPAPMCSPSQKQIT